MSLVNEAVLRDLAPGGVARVALNFGNAVLVGRDPATGEPVGITVDLARELGRRLGVPIEFVIYDGAGRVMEAVAQQAWDVAFLAIDPLRAEQVSFTPPYVIIEGTYIVRADSPFHGIDDLDADGVRIAVGKGAAYDLFLSRHLVRATLVRAPTSAAAVELFGEQGLEAAAGIRQPLEAAARARPEWRVIPGRFTAIEQALVAPAGRAEGWRYLCEFIAEMKHSGFVSAALQRHGKTDATVAP